MFIDRSLLRYGDKDLYTHKTGKGISIHFSPGNVPLQCLYTWASAFITGNVSVVRISTRVSDADLSLIRNIANFLTKYGVRDVFLFNISADLYSTALSPFAAVRLKWGSDKIVEKIRLKPTKLNCLDLCFGNKVSALLLASNSLGNIYQSDKDKDALANTLFFQDSMACTSPSSIYILSNGNESDELISRFWSLVKDIYLSSKYEQNWDFSKASIKCLSLQKKVINENHLAPVCQVHDTPITFSNTRSLIITPIDAF